MRKFLFFILAFSGLLLEIKAQDLKMVAFVYDGNGNRISESLIALRIDENEIGNDTIIDRSCNPANSFDNDTDSVDGINMSIFPNPTCGSLIISSDMSDQQDPIVATMLDFSGKVVEEKTITAPETEFNLASFPPGVYYLVIKGETENHVWKIIKNL